jgi:uncharacterized protein YbaP (TraB family)
MRRLLPAALLVFALAARADEPPDWSKSIETVVVTAHQPGPLMWRVKKGESEIVLLGMVEPLPKGLDWNKDGVRAALKGSRELLLPPRASANLFDMLWLLAWNSDALYLPGNTTVESTLPPDLRARFTTRRETIHGDADRYSNLRPPLAALRLEGDFLKARNLTQDEPSTALRQLARDAHASSRFVADYAAIPIIKQLPNMPQAANEACVTAALDDMDAVAAHATPMAQAWAVGDLDGIKGNYSEQRFESCIQSMPSFSAMFQRAVNDSLGAANAALAKPGKTVMAVPLGALLRKGGLLDRLAAEGLTVEAPGS